MLFLQPSVSSLKPDIGMAGIEPTRTCSQNTRGTTPQHPDGVTVSPMTRVGFEPDLAGLKDR